MKKSRFRYVAFVFPILALAYVFVPSALLLHDAQSKVRSVLAPISPQAPPTLAALPRSFVDAVRARSSDTGSSDPIILCYHDISENPREGVAGEYTITPQQFANQMDTLELGGYHTITASQMLDYLAGRPIPPKSVLITFDDGPRSSWVYATPILAQHHFHAVAFLITGWVGQRTYYLSWEEVQQMAQSGVWDIEAHTYLMHFRGAVDASGTQRPALTNRLWIPSMNRQETLEEFSNRVTADLDRSISDIVGHGFPRPLLFAYPFGSESTDGADQAAISIAASAVRSRFSASMLTDTETSASDVAHLEVHEVNRFQVVQSTTPADLLRVLSSSTLPLTRFSPFRFPQLWAGTGDEAFTTAFGVNDVTLGAMPGGWFAGYLGRTETALWTGYRVSTIVSNLGTDGSGASAGLISPVMDVRRLEASVSASSVTIREGISGSRVVAVRTIRTDSTHTIMITVQPYKLSVSVDGIPIFSLMAARTNPFMGGPGIMSTRSENRSPIPLLSNMEIVPLSMSGLSAMSVVRMAAAATA